MLPSVESARADLTYAGSKTGISCYAQVLERSLSGQATGGVQVGRVRLRRLTLAGPGPERSTGIRISAQVSSTSSGLSVPIYIDALGFLYGPAEIDLYATSFVQPEPVRTEQELLRLLERRALLHPL